VAMPSAMIVIVGMPMVAFKNGVIIGTTTIE
jgi:hypothetical protein